MINFLVF